MKIRLPLSAAAWGQTDFAAVLQCEIEQLPPDRLPLQQGLSATSHALDGPFRAMILKAWEQPGSIYAAVGIFYAGIIAGCSCADDPTPVEPQNEYCELLLEIDKATAETQVVIRDS